MPFILINCLSFEKLNLTISLLIAVNLHTNTLNNNVRQICFLAAFSLFISLSVAAQRRNDSAFHAIKMSKDSVKTVPVFMLSANYYTTNLGFFCKKELLVEKTVKFPIKFRLGSLQYCDAMEGKTKYGAIFPR